MKKTIFIVDDDASFKEMLTSYIETIEQDIDIISVSSISSFVLQYNKQIPDIIFLDIILPGISGIEILKFLKSLSCKSKIYIMSGFSKMSKNTNFNPDGILEKPFDLKKIESIINSVYSKID